MVNPCVGVDEAVSRLLCASVQPWKSERDCIGTSAYSPSLVKEAHGAVARVSVVASVGNVFSTRTWNRSWSCLGDMVMLMLKQTWEEEAKETHSQCVAAPARYARVYS